MGIYADKGNLAVSFTLDGRRYHEYIGEKDTVENRRKYAPLWKRMEADLKAGTFDYLVYFPNGRHADRIRRERGEVVLSARTMLGDFVETWHRGRNPIRKDGSVNEDAEIHPTTWIHDQSHVKRIQERFGKTGLADFSAADFRAWRSALGAEGVSNKTILNICGFLNKALNDAVTDGLIERNPIPSLRSKRTRKGASRSNCNPLTTEQIQDFMGALPRFPLDVFDSKRRKVAKVGPDVIRDLYFVWFRCGWRSNEIVALQFSWVDRRTETIRIEKGRSPRMGGLEALPKTLVRECDMSHAPAVLETIERRRKASIGAASSEYVFSDTRGQPLSQEWLHKRVFRPTCRLAGISDRGQYAIRDTYITLALTAREDPGWVAQTCGTSERMIWDHYRKWIPDLDRGAGRQISALLDSTPVRNSDRSASNQEGKR